MIENKVAKSALVTLDLKFFLPTEKPEIFDLKDYLYKGLILKEKDYRSALLQTDWSRYDGKSVIVCCSADVIIPVWAYMLAVVNIQPIAKEVFFDSEDTWIEKMTIRAIDQINVDEYLNQSVVIKGCGEEKIPDSAFFYITNKLLPFVKSLMYGEPCSTVPIYKKK